MKKIALISAALVIASASAALAAPMTILNSRHDMRRWNAEDMTPGAKAEVCIYCHTPHNAAINIPLWNRNNPSVSNWQLYKTSATLSSAAKNSSITDDSISLFCMSCHDGQTALGDLVNKNPYVNGYVGASGTATGWGVNNATARIQNDYAKIGGAGALGSGAGYNLANTHPIGFDFIAAQGEDSGLRDKDEIMNRFKTLDTTKSTPQNFLYLRPQSANPTAQIWFECASCHRVHDPGASGNFLRLENGASQLCLACHAK